MTRDEILGPGSAKTKVSQFAEEAWPPMSSRYERHDGRSEGRYGIPDVPIFVDARRRSPQRDGRDDRPSRSRDDRLYYEDRRRADDRRYDDRREHRRYEEEPPSYARRDRADDGRSGGRHERPPRPGNFGPRNEGEPVAFDRNSRLSPFRGDVVPLEDRPKILKNWDAAPPGFERIPADKAKLTGLFPPPGNVAKVMNFQPPVLDPARRAMLEMMTGGDASGGPLSLTSVPSAASAPNHSAPSIQAKQARRIYVGNLPPGTPDDQLKDFINKAMARLKPGRGESVVSATVSQDRNFAFVDMATADDATLAQQLDSITYDGQVLKVGRPREYQEASTTIATAGLSLNITGNHYVVMTGFPEFLAEAHLKYLLQPFGDIRTFLLLRNHQTDASLCIAAFDFYESEMSKAVCSEVDGMELGSDYILRARTIAQCYEDDRRLADILAAHSLTPGLATAEVPTPVLLLLNAVSESQLKEQTFYDELVQDMHEECSNYGAIKNLVIPQTTHGTPKILVQYETVQEAEAACHALSGRRYADRTLVVAYYPMDRYSAGDFA